MQVVGKLFLALFCAGAGPDTELIYVLSWPTRGYNGGVKNNCRRSTPNIELQKSSSRRKRQCNKYETPEFKYIRSNSQHRRSNIKYNTK